MRDNPVKVPLVERMLLTANFCSSPKASGLSIENELFSERKYFQNIRSKKINALILIEIQCLDQ